MYRPREGDVKTKMCRLGKGDTKAAYENLAGAGNQPHRRKGGTVAAEEILAGTGKNSRLIKEDAKESQIRIWPELASRVTFFN